MKEFNTTGVCVPSKHYMVDISDRLEEIKKMVDAGKYFMINRARQYGKTTTIRALKRLLAQGYIVLSLDFQSIDHDVFENGASFSQAFVIIPGSRSTTVAVQSTLIAYECACLNPLFSACPN